MLVDLHFPAEALGDGVGEPRQEALLRAARDLGLDGICLAGQAAPSRAQWERLQDQAAPLRIFVGVELRTDLGPLLWLPPQVGEAEVGLRLLPAEGQRVAAERVIDAASSVGAAVVVLQPLRGDRQRELSLARLRALGVHALEVHNAGRPDQENRAAWRVARRHSLAGVGGSGGLSSVGLVATLLGRRLACQADLVRALRRGEAWAVTLRR